jgi:autotransporter-associated beta strand protein
VEALGTTGGGTTVHATAALEIDATSGPLNFGVEAFTINGSGVDNDLFGALRVINGDVTIGTGATAFTHGSATSIGVQTGRTLTLNATVATQAFIKMGGGTLELAGNAVNSGTGTVLVQEGVLRLNKAGAVNAVTGTLTMNGASAPVTLKTEFIGAGANPFNKKDTVGFHAYATIDRTQWGVNYGVPFVGKEVTLVISAAFEKQ